MKRKKKEKKKKKKKTNSPGRDAGTSEEWKGQIVFSAKLNFSFCLLRAGYLGLALLYACALIYTDTHPEFF